MNTLDSVRATLAAALSFALLLAGCQSTPTPEAEAAPAAKPAPDKPAAAQPGAPRVEAKAVARVDLTAGQPGDAGRDALKDPASLLSKRSVYYDYDKYDIKDDYKPIVDAHARYLRERREAKMLIQGNTDERGSREYNIALGQRRAEGVKRLLILLGAREEQVEAVSFGEEKPKAQGSTEDAYAENRRSDVLYNGEY